jgi:hypothetical protein
MSQEWEPDCPGCGGEMRHIIPLKKANRAGCEHWYCDRCKAYNYPAGMDITDPCPICNPYSVCLECMSVIGKDKWVEKKQ